jgi:hypothetical protein
MWRFVCPVGEYLETSRTGKEPGGPGVGKRISECLEESPFLLARPPKPKSCDVLRVERPAERVVG